ncbi:MAG TPA: ATP-binding protein [Vicinamibacteria bacterium]|nr:ATP-binding protein [Vicinamibacteria bacterium]
MTSLTLAQKSDLEPQSEANELALPKAPVSPEDTGISREFLLELTLRIAQTTKQFTTEWLAERICLPSRVVLNLVDELRTERTLAVLGQSGNFGLQLGITERGRAVALESMKTTSYVGPAPVTLKAYSDLMEAQLARLPKVTPERVSEAISELVLPEETVQIAGLASFSSRSLFLHGPPGNGKTSLGQMLHAAVDGDLWIPHCIGIGNSIIRVFDPECHRPTTWETRAREVDRRWMRIRRPFIIAGGELTIESLDLAYHEGLGYYEGPLHLKANGGTFLIDDFGHQRVDHSELLNRWIHPLESRVDYLTLKTGQKFPVPFRPMLIISTNLDPDKVMDPAFLRRMGYRIFMNNPTPTQYREIFERYAQREGITVPEGLLDTLLQHYQADDRPHRSCEARDLIERAKDICRYRSESVRLTDDIMDLAWRGYFGRRERWAENSTGEPSESPY